MLAHKKKGEAEAEAAATFGEETLVRKGEAEPHTNQLVRE